MSQAKTVLMERNSFFFPSMRREKKTVSAVCIIGPVRKTGVSSVTEWRFQQHQLVINPLLHLLCACGF